VTHARAMQSPHRRVRSYDAVHTQRCNPCARGLDLATIASAPSPMPSAFQSLHKGARPCDALSVGIVLLIAFPNNPCTGGLDPVTRIWREVNSRPRNLQSLRRRARSCDKIRSTSGSPGRRPSNPCTGG
jgi:hypothetical protein